MAKTSEEGGCLCGTVRYRLEGAPTNSMICHCKTCRRVGGAPVMAWLTFPSQRVTFLHGRPREYSSSPPVRRTFCGSCGTPLTYEHSGEPGFVEVTACTLDNPGAFPPTHHSWLSHAVAWAKFGDGLATFQESRYGGADRED